MTSRETPELLTAVRERYVVRAGRLHWKRDGRGTKAGDEAGCFDSKGYRIVRVTKRVLKVHRVIFALHHGRWPDGDIDHRNGVRSDNRPRNLREAGRSENMWNRRAHVTSKSGILGVCWSGGKWVAQLRHKRVAVLHKSFSTLEAAVAARRAAERKYFGVFAPQRKAK